MGANPSGIADGLPVDLTKPYKGGAGATIDLQRPPKLPACRKSGKQKESMETIMKTLFFSIALGLGLALWGAEPQAGIDHLMAAGKIAGEQVYSMLR